MLVCILEMGMLVGEMAGIWEMGMLVGEMEGTRVGMTEEGMEKEIA